jgi:hypothetical protein
MYVVVSWDISASGEEWESINARLKDGLSNFSWARPLSTFYVVRITSEEERQTIQSRLLTVAKSVAKNVHFLISPAMAGGRFTGFLPQDMWENLNERSDP